MNSFHNFTYVVKDHFYESKMSKQTTMNKAISTKPSKRATKISRSIHTAIFKKDASTIPKLSKHCIATIVVENPAKLYDSKGFSEIVHQIVEAEDAHCVGEVSYDFDNNSFTSVFALSESHISAHTWPERLTVQLDVFLCNYMNDNTDRCQRIFDEIVNYFEPKQVEVTYVERL